MDKIQYEYLGPEGQRRSETLSLADAEAQLGSRVLTGWDVVSRYVESPDKTTHCTVTYLVSMFGRVWAIYTSESF